MPRNSNVCPHCNLEQNPQFTGDKLVGRELLVKYNDDQWYSVIVIRYYPREDEYKIVYQIDDGLETRKLVPGRWLLVPKRRQLYDNRILQGCIIEFTYPSDGQRHRAMVYDYAHTGERIKIAYLNEDHTDILKGGGWDFITESPCIYDPSAAQ